MAALVVVVVGRKVDRRCMVVPVVVVAEASLDLVGAVFSVVQAVPVEQAEPEQQEHSPVAAVEVQTQVTVALAQMVSAVYGGSCDG